MSQKKNIIFFKEPVFKVAREIFNKPSKVFHIRMLEKLTKLSTTSITSAVNELKYYEIVTIEKTPITSNIKANIESEEYKYYKMVFNLYQLIKSKFIFVLKFTYRPELVVIFGSYAKGEDFEGSDVDILIISSKTTKVSGIGKEQEELEKEIERNINLHIISSLDKSSPEFKNSIANGIILHGYAKVV